MPTNVPFADRFRVVCNACVGAFALFAAFCLSARTASGDDEWPQFRGPRGDGHSDATGVPLKWSETENIVWKTAVPGKGYSSPVIGGNSIWMTTATEKDRSLRAVCVDRKTGKILHDVEIFFLTRKKMKVWPTNSNASPTPVLDEGRLYVHFGKFGNACLDAATGEIIWKNKKLRIYHEVGPGSSPIVWKNLMIVNYDGYDKQFVVALDKTTGDVVWKTKRSGKQPRRGTEKKSHSTPVIVKDATRTQMISPSSDWVYSYDPATGKELWLADYGPLGFEVIPRPVVGHGMVYVTTGTGTPQLLAIRYDGNGDVTESHIVWRYKKNISQIPSLLLVGDLLFMVSDKGISTCLDAKTGKVFWKNRVGRSCSASPVYVDGRIYSLSHSGKSVVVKPGKKREVLAVNHLDGLFKASIAVAGRAMYVRSATHLYRIEESAR